MSDVQQLENGQWVPAKEEPYYPSIWERIGHFFGKHIMPYDGKGNCLLTGCDYRN